MKVWRNYVYTTKEQWICLSVGHGWSHRSIWNGNIKMKHNCKGDQCYKAFILATCKDKWGVVSNDFKGVFNHMSKTCNNILYWYLIFREKITFNLLRQYAGICNEMIDFFLVVNLYHILFVFGTPWVLIILFIYHKNWSL